MEKYLCNPFHFAQKENSNPAWIHIQLSLTPRETEIMFQVIQKTPLFFKKKHIDPTLFKLIHPP